jgi:hypothetical protein
MKALKSILTISILLSLVASCSIDKKEIKPTKENANYAPTILPKDTTKLWMSEGSIKSDTILILGDGGPKNQLDYEFNGKISMRYLPNFKNYFVVNLHQSSTYNKEIFNWKEGFTLEMAKKEVENSSEMLYRTIKYFKDRNKYVVVIGHSYSAFIIPNYLATKPSLADTYITTGGRVKADSLQTVYQLKNINTMFQEDGTKIMIPDENRPPNPYLTKRYYQVRQAKNLLKAAIGQIDYTKELKDKKLSNWYFIYGNKDRNVGVPKTEELEFLKSKKVKVFEIDSDHYNIYRGFVDYVKDGTIKF